MLQLFLKTYSGEFDMRRQNGMRGIAVALLFFLFSAETRAAGCGDSVTVRAGDTLAGIAERCGISVSSIVAANPAVRNPDVIAIGQVIVVPGKPRAGPKHVHFVAPGDTLLALSQRYELSVAAILHMNPDIDDPTRLPVGFPLRLGALGARLLPRAPVAPTSDRLSFHPTSGPPGSSVRVRVRSYPPRTQVRIGFSKRADAMWFVSSARTDARGTLVADLIVPEYFGPRDRLLIGARAAGGLARDRTGYFLVTENIPPEDSSH
jgi:LysM repeat protein